MHANPKVIRFALGRASGQDLILTGPSNLGLAEPGQGTALSLYQLTVLMMTKHPSIGSLLVSRTLGHLVDEISDAFVAEHKAIARHIRTRRRAAEAGRRRKARRTAARR